MSKRRIPKPKLECDLKSVPKPSFLPSDKDSSVVFSFVSLEWTEYFSLDATCPNWFYDLLNMLKSVSKISKTDLLSGKFKTYRVHTHENAKPPNSLPGGPRWHCYRHRWKPCLHGGGKQRRCLQNQELRCEL